MNQNLFLTPTDILLPAHADMRRWSVIACDQFTADAGYWQAVQDTVGDCLLYTSPSPRDRQKSRMPSSA